MKQLDAELLYYNGATNVDDPERHKVDKPHIKGDPFRSGEWICTYVERTKFCNLKTHGTGRTPVEAYENMKRRLLKS